VDIIFRVDASFQIGTGHVIRCLTLAEELKESGANVGFICRKHIGNLINKILSEGFNVFDSQESIIGICVPGASSYSRKQIDELTDWVKNSEINGAGLIWVKYDLEGNTAIEDAFNEILQCVKNQ
jgi:hypothetical protein